MRAAQDLEVASPAGVRRGDAPPPPPRRIGDAEAVDRERAPVDAGVEQERLPAERLVEHAGGDDPDARGPPASHPRSAPTPGRAASSSRAVTIAMKPRIEGTEAAVEAPSRNRVNPSRSRFVVAQVRIAATIPNSGPTCITRWWPRRSDSRPNGGDRISSAAKNVAENAPMTTGSTRGTAMRGQVGQVVGEQRAGQAGAEPERERAEQHGVQRPVHRGSVAGRRGLPNGAVASRAMTDRPLVPAPLARGSRGAVVAPHHLATGAGLRALARRAGRRSTRRSPPTRCWRW